MVCRLMMCESFEVMASETLVGMMPAAFVNECMSTDQCLPILVEWADLGRGAPEPAFTLRLAPQC